MPLSWPPSSRARRQFPPRLFQPTVGDGIRAPAFWRASQLTASLPWVASLCHAFALAAPPLELFLDFQYGLQRWWMLGLSGWLLFQVERPSQRIPPPQPPPGRGRLRLQPWWRTQVILATTVLWHQWLFSLSAWVGAWITCWPAPIAGVPLSQTCQPIWFATGAVCNALMILGILSLMRLFCLLGLRPAGAIMIGAVVMIAGLSQPLRIGPFPSSVPPGTPLFPWLSWIEWGIPSLWRLDLWWLNQQGLVDNLTRFSIGAAGAGVAWLAAIQLACAAILALKRP